MTNKDRHIWNDYTRDVRPLGKKAVRPVHEIHRNTLGWAKPLPANIAIYNSPPPALLADIFPNPYLERRREKALREGSIGIEGRLDLHGMRQDEAFDALSTFMREKVKMEKRRLLIVTGKGRGSEGVLRRNLESWLRQLPEARSILALRQAAPKHGGEGAFYVLLKRKNKYAGTDGETTSPKNRPF